jgi:alkaline phosphatase D
VFQDFDPFWEFVSGPIHAGTGRPDQIDNTFGPQVVFAKGLAHGVAFAAPTDGLQFFGHVAIDGATEVMTVMLKDVDDNALWSRQLEPKFA